MSYLLLALAITAFSSPVEDECARFGEALAAAEELEEAERSFEVGLSCYGAPSEETGTSIQNIFHQMVNAYYDAGHYEGAFRTIDRFFEHFREFEAPNLYFRMYQWEGFLHFDRAELDRAVQSYARSFAYTESVAPAERAHVAEQVAVLYKRLQDVAAARSFLEKAREIMAGADYESERDRWIHVRVLNTESYLLVSEALGGEEVDVALLERAAGLAREALELLEGLPLDAEHGSAYVRLGQHALYAGDYAGAGAYLDEAERLARQLDDANLLTSIAYNRGMLYLVMEDFVRARLAFQQTYAQAVPADFASRAEALLSLGLLAELQEEPERAEEHYRAAIEQHQLRRSLFRATQWAAMDERLESTYRALIRSLLAQGRHEEAFRTLDRGSAQHLEDVRLQSRVLGEADLATREAFDALTAEIATVRHGLFSDTLTSDRRSRLLTEEARLLAERRALLELDALPEPPALSELQKQLAKEDMVLLAYFVDRADPVYPTTSRSHVFLLRADTLVARPLPATRGELVDALAEVSPLLAPGGQGSMTRDEFSLEALHELYEMLVEPVAAHIPEGARLAVVPDSPLHALPFGLLVREPTRGYHYRSAPFLLREHPVSTEVAARFLMEEAPGAAPSLDVVAFGKASFGSEVQGTTRAEAGRHPELPAVRAEVSGIERLFGRVEVALDEEATETALLDAIDRPAVIHLASHTQLDHSRPFRNAVVLAPDPADTTGFYDGRFHLSKLEERSLAAELVVLSGCDTARGAELPGEGMASLQYGFRTLGVPSSVATLWLVDDEASARLMTAFYRNLRAGEPKDVALQQAQLAYLEEAGGIHTSPFFWAAPVLYGSARPVALEARPFYRAGWFQLAAIVAAVVLLGGGLLRRRNAQAG